SSFYKIPRCQTYASWSLSVPENFQFSVKLWKGITHNKEYDFDWKTAQAFFSALDCLGKNKGCLLIQFPAGSNMDEGRLDNLLKKIRKLDPKKQWRLAVEFRHPRWYTENFIQLIEAYGACMVLHDMPNSLIHEPVGDPSFVYLRFHGEKGD